MAEFYSIYILNMSFECMFHQLKIYIFYFLEQKYVVTKM